MCSCRIVVDDFDRESIRRRISQLHQAKEHPTLSKLQVRNLSFVVPDVGNLYYSSYRKCCESVHFFSGKRSSLQKLLSETQERSDGSTSAQESSSQETYTAGSDDSDSDRGTSEEESMYSCDSDHKMSH